MIRFSNKGITLIALVITIVVLIILAAVAINLSIGNNGIFNRAKQAKEEYTNAQGHETEQVNELDDKITQYANASKPKVNYTLTLYPNGGNGEIYTQTYLEGSTFELPSPTFTKSNYSLGGWNTKSDGSGIFYETNNTITITKDLTLYAQWNLVLLSSEGKNSNYTFETDVHTGITKTAEYDSINKLIHVATSYGNSTAIFKNVNLANYSKIHYSIKTSAFQEDAHAYKICTSLNNADLVHGGSINNMDVYSPAGYTDYYLDVSDYTGTCNVGLYVWCNNSPYGNYTGIFEMWCNYIELIP